MNNHLYNIIKNVYLPELFSNHPVNSYVCGATFSNYTLPLTSLNMYSADEVGETLADVLADMVEDGEVVFLSAGNSFYFRKLAKGAWN